MTATLASAFLPIRDPAVADVEAFRQARLRSGLSCSPVGGDPARCLFLTVTDPDGNTVLVVDR